LRAFVIRELDRHVQVAVAPVDGRHAAQHVIRVAAR
jgi:hypothetical protein